VIARHPGRGAEAGSRKVIAGSDHRVPGAHNRAVDGFDLEPFVAAQSGIYADVVAELGAARKSSHWMWFVFPQIAGLGMSPTSQRYAIGSLAEARAYLAHPVLGARLLECTQLVLSAPSTATADSIFGGIDARKLRSSMTLFLRAAPDEALWQQVLDRYFGGSPDTRTDQLLDAD
jgi:uncharacterized protein (DUF1810 family)